MRSYRVMNGPGHRRDGGFMKDDVGACDGLCDGVVVADIDVMKFDVTEDFREVFGVSGEEIVYYYDIPAATLQETPDKGRPDKTSTAGNHIFLHRRQRMDSLAMVTGSGLKSKTSREIQPLYWMRSRAFKMASKS
jgi:hypothetical protein